MTEKKERTVNDYAKENGWWSGNRRVRLIDEMEMRGLTDEQMIAALEALDSVCNVCYDGPTDCKCLWDF